MTLPWVVGQEVTADTLNNMSNADTALVAKGVIARGRRTTSTGTFTTTETGVLRLDDIPVYADRVYAVTTSCINMDTSVSNDIAQCALRYSTSGAATTSSTIIITMRQTIDDATTSNIVPMNGFYYSAADDTLSVLLSCVRSAGTGNIIVFSSTNQPTDLVVTDLGPAPADTGVII